MNSLTIDSTECRTLLCRLCAESGTDKCPYSLHGHRHPYTAPYSLLLEPLRHKPIKFAEIGVFRGHSLLMWHDYFPNAEIYGVDINITNQAISTVNPTDEIVLERADAYSEDYVNKFLNDGFDYIIDDGPHTLWSQIAFIELYYKKIKKGGKLIIEDIQSKSDLEAIEQRLKELKYKYKIFDLTANKGRYDDIIIEITK